MRDGLLLQQGEMAKARANEGDVKEEEGKGNDTNG